MRRLRFENVRSPLTMSTHESGDNGEHANEACSRATYVAGGQSLCYTREMELREFIARRRAEVTDELKGTTAHIAKLQAELDHVREMAGRLQDELVDLDQAATAIGMQALAIAGPRR